MSDDGCALTSVTTRLDTAGSLPRAARGLDAATVNALLGAFDTGRLEIHSVMVVQHGQVVAEGWWAPYTASGLHFLYSLSKSFTSAAIGLAVHEGLLSVSHSVASFFPESIPPRPDPRMARVTVRHLLTMSTGHSETAAAGLDRSDPVSSFLSSRLEHEPGGLFVYNGGATTMLSAILTKSPGSGSWTISVRASLIRWASRGPTGRAAETSTSARRASTSPRSR